MEEGGGGGCHIADVGKGGCLEERNAHYLEVSRRDRVRNGSILPRLRAHAALHREGPPRNSMQVQRNIRGDGGGLDVRQGAQAIQQAGSKLALGGPVGVASA